MTRFVLILISLCLFGCGASDRSQKNQATGSQVNKPDPELEKLPAITEDELETIRTRIEDATLIHIEVASGIRQFWSCDVFSTEDKAALCEWLKPSRAFAVNEKISGCGGIEITASNGITYRWMLIEFSDDEFGIMQDGDHYWRGLSRLEFRALLSHWPQALK